MTTIEIKRDMAWLRQQVEREERLLHLLRNHEQARLSIWIMDAQGNTREALLSDDIEYAGGTVTVTVR